MNITTAEYKIAETPYANPTLHRVLFTSSAALSIAAVVPGARPIASLILRSIAFISSTALCADSWEKADFYTRMLNIARIGIVSLAIVGVVTAKPLLFVASLAAEAGLQALEAGKAIYDGDTERALSHLGILAVDSLMLAAVITGSWQIMVTAAAVNAAVVLVFAINALERGDPVIDAICYAALAASSITASCQTARLVDEGLYRYGGVRNGTDNVREVYEKGYRHHDEWRHVATLKPGEQFHHPYGPSFGTLYKFIQLPLDTKYYPTLPIGGTIIVNPLVPKKI